MLARGFCIFVLITGTFNDSVRAPSRIVYMYSDWFADLEGVISVRSRPVSLYLIYHHLGLEAFAGTLCEGR